MARLIVGHTTDTTTRIWVRGDTKYPWACVRLNDGQHQSIQLEDQHGFTGITDFKGLGADQDYEASVRFGPDQSSAENDGIDFGDCNGRLRTFPLQGQPADFSFIVGSCNLHALGPFQDPDKAYQTLAAQASARRCAFMIHCGDQIYADIPLFPSPDPEHYRKKYIDAWGDSRYTRRILTRLPHYMILDDHEIVNDFANDMKMKTGTTASYLLMIATKVYREFVNIRNPGNFGGNTLHYSFDMAHAKFFVLDTRTERNVNSGDESCLIGSQQLQRFKTWLRQHKNELKFVVTSVPFVGEVTGKKGRFDKWCSPVEGIRRQRHEIIDFIATERIQKLVFLTGDMHNSYHAVMDIGGGGGAIRIHEIMSSPINQIAKSSISKYSWGQNQTTAASGTQFKVSLGPQAKHIDDKGATMGDPFYDAHSNAVAISVNGATINYDVIRTKQDKVEMTGSFVP